MKQFSSFAVDKIIKDLEGNSAFSKAVKGEEVWVSKWHIKQSLNNYFKNLKEEIDKEILDFNNVRKNNEFVCPEEHIMKHEIANLPHWVKVYFENKGLQKAKSIIFKMVVRKDKEHN